MMSKLAIFTSAFIVIIVIYSFLKGEPLYQLTHVTYRLAIICSIISIGIHLNALFKQKDKGLFLKFSFIVPLAVTAYFIIGVFYWFNSEK